MTLQEKAVRSVEIWKKMNDSGNQMILPKIFKKIKIEVVKSENGKSYLKVWTTSRLGKEAVYMSANSNGYVLQRTNTGKLNFVFSSGRIENIPERFKK